MPTIDAANLVLSLDDVRVLYPNTDPATLPRVDLEDCGRDWGFQCPACGSEQRRDGPLGDDDVLMCECGQLVVVA